MTWLINQWIIFTSVLRRPFSYKYELESSVISLKLHKNGLQVCENKKKSEIAFVQFSHESDDSSDVFYSMSNSWFDCILRYLLLSGSRRIIETRLWRLLIASCIRTKKQFFVDKWIPAQVKWIRPNRWYTKPSKKYIKLVEQKKNSGPLVIPTKKGKANVG